MQENSSILLRFILNIADIDPIVIQLLDLISSLLTGDNAPALTVPCCNGVTGNCAGILQHLEDFLTNN